MVSHNWFEHAMVHTTEAPESRKSHPWVELKPAGLLTTSTIDAKEVFEELFPSSPSACLQPAWGSKQTEGM